MNKPDKLKRLIEVLSPSERRKFKLDTKFSSGQSEYLKLFDQLSKSVTTKGKPKNFAAHKKKYLYQKILESLRNKETNNIEKDIAQYLLDIESLYEKGLFQDCLKQIDRLKLWAEEQCTYGFLCKLIKLQLKINFNHLCIYHNCDKLIDDLNQAIEKENRIHRYYQLYFKLRSTNIEYNLKGDSNTLFESLHDEPLVNKPDKDLDPLGQYYFNWIHLFIAVSQAKREDHVHWAQKNFQLLQEFPSLFKNRLRMASGILYQQLRAASFKSNAEDIFLYLSQMNRLAKNNRAEELAVFINTYSIKLNYLSKIKEDKKAFRTYLKIVEGQMHLFYEDLPKIKQVVLYNNLGIAYTYLGDFKKATQLLHECISSSSSKDKLQHDILAFAELLYLTVLFRLGQSVELDKQLAVLKRKIQQKDPLTYLYEWFYDYYSQAVHLTPKELADHWEKCAEDLKTRTGPGKRVIRFFDFTDWFSKEAVRLRTEH